MKRGRKGTELKQAIHWLEIRLSNGPVLATDIKRAPFSWMTLNRCKKQMNLSSKNVNGKWWWYRVDKHVFPDNTNKTNNIQPTQPKPLTKSVKELFEAPSLDYVEPEPLREFDPDTCLCTEAMIDLIKRLILNGKSDKDIMAELVGTCRLCPMPMPYSIDYIESVFNHEMHNTPIRHDLNLNSPKI